MPSRRHASFFRHCIALVLAGLLGCAHAAELGDVAVGSYIGQPLAADIELISLADPAAPVAVKLANTDVYRGANITMHPVLANLAMSVVRRDGRQFLHITSTRTVATEYVHLFVELAEGNKRNVRAATLWLAPDPAPAPPPPKPVAPVVPAVPPPTPAPAVAPPSRVVYAPKASVPAPVCPAPQFSEEQVKACAATDYQNGLLSAQIVELEEKVKSLQKALDAKAANAAPPPPPPRPKPEVTESAGFPWLLAAGIVVALAAAGGGGYYFLRRRKASAAAAVGEDK